MPGTVVMAGAQGTAFTYQGRLSDGGSAANGNYDIQFTLFATNVNGIAIAGPVTNVAVNAANGLFLTTVDFGNAYGGSNWLELAVSTNGANAYTTLVPRQQLTPVPFALQAGSAMWVAATNLAGNIADTQLSTNVVFLNGSPSFAGTVSATNFSGNGAGLTNVPGTLQWQTVSGTNQQAAGNMGYIVTNNFFLTNFQVTITLPVSNNIGDIVRVTDFGGNWKVGQNTGQAIQGPAGEFAGYTAWTNHLPLATWSSLDASGDGSQLIAAAEDTLYTSSDSGNTWVQRTNFQAGYYVAASTDGTKMVAVGNGSIATSTNSGVTWATQSISQSSSWRGVASSTDGSRLVVVPGSGYIYTSPDYGVDWIQRIGFSLNWYSVASSADGSKLVALANPGIYTSTNYGSSWLLRTNLSLSVGSYNGPFVACSTDCTRIAVAAVNGSALEPIYTSYDSGATWKAQNIGDQSWTSIACSADGTKIFATDGSSTGGPRHIYASQDSGVSWQPLITTNFNWSSVAVSSDGTKITATGNAGYIYTQQFAARSATSTGTNGYLLGGTGSAVELQYMGAGQFIPISHEGNITAY
ncbi:MAG TPA: hypothetical protein VK742_03200 [Candidatus Sulfotelmatobacter sp.]|nr:hypothetical protein [Candidatus Sulfotelmatobacter sp.]